MSDRPAIRKVCRGVYTCGHGLMAIRHTGLPLKPDLIRPGVGWTLYMDGRIVCNQRRLREAVGQMGRILDRRAAAILKGEA